MIISTKDFDESQIKEDTVLELAKDIRSEDLLIVIEKILSLERDKRFDNLIVMSKLDFLNRITLLKHFMSDCQIENSSILLNIMNFMKSYNSLSDDFFKNDLVIVNSVVEFLDMKTELKDEILRYLTEFCRWYLSLFVSLHKIDLNFLDNIVEMPKSYLKLLLTFDFFTMSGILAKAENILTSDLYLVKDAYNVFSVLVEKNFVSNKLLESFIQKISGEK